MFRSVGTNPDGVVLYEDDTEDVGQEWIARTLKCAHCGYRFVGVYPEGMTSNNCPECQRTTRIRVLY